jgi:hypothetical protein
LSLGCIYKKAFKSLGLHVLGEFGLINNFEDTGASFLETNNTSDYITSNSFLIQFKNTQYLGFFFCPATKNW